MSRLLMYGIKQQKRKASLGFETYVAPDNFDRTAQPVDIYDVFNKYYKTNSDAKYIYSVINATTTFTFYNGNSYRYGYTNGGVDYVVDINATTIMGGYSAGSRTSIPVDSVVGFPSSGTIRVGDGSLFVYTSLDTTPGANAFVGASQSMIIATNGSAVNLYITWVGTKRWVIVQVASMVMQNCDLASQPAEWLYCGNLINSINTRNIKTLKYIHIHRLDNITTYSMYSQSGCTGLTGNVYISNTATAIAAYAFDGCTNITGTLTMGTSITSVGGQAFLNCKFTGDLTLPNSLTNIGSLAFNTAGFTGTLTLGNAVTTIASQAFQVCGFTGNLNIPSTVTSIGGKAFQVCGFTGTLIIPSNVTSIGEAAFYFINFDTLDVSANSGYHAHDGVLYQESTHTALYSLKTYSGTVTLENDTLIIGEYCFGSNARTGALSIPNSIASIHSYAFDNCSGFNSTLTFGTGLKSIYQYAFNSCTGFTGTLTIPDNVTTLGVGAFRNCNHFNALSLSTNVVILSNYVFQNCAAMRGNLLIPNSVTTIGASAFDGCGFDGTLTMGTSITSVGGQAFLNCKFTGDLTLPNSLTNIGSLAFNTAGFTGTLTLGNAVTTIASQAFQVCGFTGNLNIPSTVTSIGGYSSFGYCNFSTITSDSISYPVSDNVLYDKKVAGTVIAILGARAYSGTLTIDTTTTLIAASAFYGNTLRTGALIIPNTVTAIAANAFQNCAGFTSLVIGTGVTSIPAYCFDGSGAFTGTLTIPSGITSLGAYAFRGNAWTRVDSYRSTAPTTSTGTFDNDAMELHIPTGGGTGYGVAPWTTAATFTQPAIADL